MDTMKKMALSNEKGFVLLAALIACLIIIAVGILVINLSTGDLMSSSVNVGTKKAFAGVESGIYRVMQDFQPDSNTWTLANHYTQDCTVAPSNYNWRSINTGTDPNTQFATCKPAMNHPPVSVMGTSLCVYDEVVVGQNTTYDSMATVSIGIGVFCPGQSSATPTTYR